MAVRRTLPKPIKKDAVNDAKKQAFCRDCIHHYNEHEKNVSGENFMCNCPFFRWARFLNTDTCDKFTHK